MKYRLLYSIILSTILLSGCSRENEKAKHSFPVIVGEVTQKDVPIYLEAIGNVDTPQLIQIRPQVGGIIQEAFAKEGQFVKAGDLLYKIDPRPYQAAVDQAKAILQKDKATLKFSETQVERNAELVKKDYISKLAYEQFVSQVDINKAQIKNDEALLAIAELNLEWTEIKSPIDGKISNNNVDVGNLVVANNPNFLTTLQQINPIDVRFNIPQESFLKVQQALKDKTLKFQAILPQKPDTPREGEIYFIDNQLNPSTGTIRVFGRVNNDDHFLWPQEFVKVKILLRVEKDAILVPEEAVKIGNQGAYVYIYNPNTSTAELRLVKKGATFENHVVILDGIKLGEKVIVQGQNNLLPGSTVNVSLP